MNTIKPEVGLQFNSTGIFSDFCATSIGATVNDMKVAITFELLDSDDKPTGDTIFDIEVFLAMAQEVNALHEYLNALHECYGEDCGHHYMFRIELLEFTPWEAELSPEDRMREIFNLTFASLDDCKSAGSFYTGDNGAFILQYLDTTEAEQEVVWNILKDKLAAKHCMQKTRQGSTMLVEIY
jgi:hypothetical protein